MASRQRGKVRSCATRPRSAATIRVPAARARSTSSATAGWPEEPSEQAAALGGLCGYSTLSVDMPLAVRHLPPHYAITPEPGDDDAVFLARIDRALGQGVRLLQLRAKAVSPVRLRALAKAVKMRAREAGATLLLNAQADLARELDLDGVHLPAAGLMRCHERPLPGGRRVAASCHDARELAHAAKIGVDFAVLGPVLTTRSHPGAPVLGWPAFAELCADTSLPVYAIGGLGPADVTTARANGARGVAGISGFFSR